MEDDDIADFNYLYYYRGGDGDIALDPLYRPPDAYGAERQVVPFQVGGSIDADLQALKRRYPNDISNADVVEGITREDLFSKIEVLVAARDQIESQMTSSESTEIVTLPYGYIGQSGPGRLGYSLEALAPAGVTTSDGCEVQIYSVDIILPLRADIIIPEDDKIDIQEPSTTVITDESDYDSVGASCTPKLSF